MYLHKVVNLDKNLSKVQKNKELHKAAFNLLEENLIKEFRLKKEDRSEERRVGKECTG